MNHSMRCLVLTAGMIAAGSVFAEGTNAEMRSVTRIANNATPASRGTGMNRMSSVIGSDVDDQHGNKIGEIKDIVFDRKQGQIAYAVVGFGGVMGVGSKYFAIPWKKMTPGEDDHYVLQVDKETLKRTPGFDKDHWPDIASAQWNTDNERFYRQSPYWQRGGERNGADNSGKLAARTASVSTGAGMAGTVDAGGPTEF